MAFVDPDTVHTPSSGATATSAWGTTTNDNANWMATDHPHCIVYHNTTQTLTHNTITTLSANSEISDIGNMHSTVTDNSRVTIPSGGDGLYSITGNVGFAGATGGHRLLRALVDGTTSYTLQQVSSHPDGGIGTVISGTIFVHLVAGQYVELQARQTSGGDLAAGINTSGFAVRWIATA